MVRIDDLDESIRRIERLPIPPEEKAFLIEVRRQFEAEVASQAAGPDKGPSPPKSQ
jgi:hypothetical protein